MEKIQRKMHPSGFKEEIEFMDLPWGIICSILSRLPLKSIGQFMCVSKSFRAIKNDSYFVELHITKAKFQPVNYILKEKPEFAKYRRNHNFFNNPDVPMSDPGKTLYLVGEGKHNVNMTTKIPIIAEVQDDMLRLVGSCNGLLCFSRDKDRPSSKSIIIYNPITREYMLVPTTFGIVGKKCINASISFVFEAISKTYKVVILSDDRNGKGTAVYILTLGETSWRKSNLPFGLEFRKYSDNNKKKSVLFNGSLYWIMENNTGSTPKKAIISMEISSENFQVIGLNDPILQNPPNTPYTHYFLLNSGKSLELAVHDYSDKQRRMNVWELMDVKRGIWSHQSTHHLGSFLGCKRDPEKYSCAVRRNAGDDSLLVEFKYFDESMRGSTYVLGPEYHHLVCYTPKDKKFSIDIVSDIEIPQFFDVFTFLPSIVSPKF